MLSQVFVTEHCTPPKQIVEDIVHANIDKGFGDLIRRLEEKRDELKNEFAGKYVAEENKLLTRA